ncbi:MAG: 5-formyltetrahydrofolate cyclo-ligase [Phycisphaerales bacterium JB052]
MTHKASHRDEINRQLAMLTTEQQALSATSTAPHLITALAPATTILAYASFGTELCLDPFITAAIESGRRVCIPRIGWEAKSMAPVAISNLHDDLEMGRYGIRVPRDGLTVVEPAELDVILLPGLAFDRAGNRLGRGAGFYDRFISALHHAGHRPTLIGVCHHAQIVDSVPTEPHDHPVDRIITELGPLDPV